MLGIISGTVLLKEGEIFCNAREVFRTNEYGEARLMLSDKVAFIARHGYEHYILPHMINHQANIQAFKEIGVKEIIGINSTGSLKMALQPGKIVIPDDFIMLASYPTCLIDQSAHITVGLNMRLREKLLHAASKIGIDAQDGGVYWQTSGPRLETRSEIKLMSQFADLVGMTMASEAIVAQELGLAYASVCSVDNYAHGIAGKSELDVSEIAASALVSGKTMSRLIVQYLSTI